MANPDFNNDLGTDFARPDPVRDASLPTDAGAQGSAQAPLSSQWTKLGIINEALINTANNTVSLPENVASDEWRVGSSVYDQWLSLTLARRDWNFATAIGTCYRTGDSKFPGYADVLAKPPDCLFLVNCWRYDLAGLVQPSTFGAPREMYDTRPPALDYKIIGDEIHTTVGIGEEFGGDFSDDFTDTGPAFCEYIPFPSQSTRFSIGFVAALRLKVEAGLYRALNEDSTLAMWAEKASEAALQEAASRVDQQEPRRVAFRSRLLENRRLRRGGCR